MIYDALQLFNNTPMIGRELWYPLAIQQFAMKKQPSAVHDDSLFFPTVIFHFRNL